MRAGYPQPNHQPALRRLWQAAFGDEDDFLDLFFGLAYDPQRCRCITESRRKRIFPPRLNASVKREFAAACTWPISYLKRWHGAASMG